MKPLRLLILLPLFLMGALRAEPVEQWGIFELSLAGPSEGNPFIDVELSATFTDGHSTFQVGGFYDGEGVYRVRFMPNAPGEWKYETKSNRWPLTAKKGTFTVVPARPGNRGPVRVAHTFHFAYADGTPFKQVGTTCYTWTHRTEEIEQQTLRTLAASPFNKLRMCVFPQTHGIKTMPPPRFPFAGEPTKPDYSRFNPAFFQHLDKRVGQLRDLGIECDLILFHPYDDDRIWGLDTMDPETENRYLRYIVARLGAYRNIWWSMANEYDFVRTKTEADWDRYFQVVQAADPYNHLRSNHNGKEIYNHTKPWVTHVSMQNGSALVEPGRALLYRDVYRKPIVYDEVEYEGNHHLRWAKLSGREMVHRFWVGTVSGNYVGHSEYLAEPGDIGETVWLGQGGVLKGESPARLAFLRKVMEESPATGIEPIDKWWQPNVGGRAGEYYLIYFGHETPTEWPFALYRDGIADGTRFSVEILDTWDMTITPVAGEFVAKRRDNYMFGDATGRIVTLPGKPGIALRIRKVGGATGAITDRPPGN